MCNFTYKHAELVFVFTTFIVVCGDGISFGAQSFVFQVAIQKFKDQDI